MVVFCLVIFLERGCCGFYLFSSFTPEKAGKGIGTVSEGCCVARQLLLPVLICEGHTFCSTLVDDCSVFFPLSQLPVNVVIFFVLLLLDRNQNQSVLIFGSLQSGNHKGSACHHS